jgi:hypothetical protein
VLAVQVAVEMDLRNQQPQEVEQQILVAEEVAQVQQVVLVVL